MVAETQKNEMEKTTHLVSQVEDTQGLEAQAVQESNYVNVSLRLCFLSLFPSFLLSCLI